MLSWFRTLFYPPELEDRTQAVILNAVLLVAIFLAAAGITLSILVNFDDIFAWGIYIPVLFLLISLYGMMRQGHVQAVSWLLVIGLWLLVTAYTLLTGGLESPLPSGYPVLVVIAALVLGSKGGMGTAAVNSVTIAIFYFLAAADALPAPLGQISLLNLAIMDISLNVVMALFLHIAVFIIAKSYQQASSSKANLQNVLEDLRSTSVSQSYVNNIIQSMSNLLIVLDGTGNIRTVNPATLNLLGYEEDELIGQPFNAVITGDPSRLSSTLIVKSGQMRNVDHYYRARDGRLVPVSMSSSVMYDSEGDVVGVVCVAQDITQRKETEEKLRYQASLLENVSDAIISTTMDLKIMTWNSAAEEVYGWTAREVIGRDLSEVIQINSGGDAVTTLEIESTEAGHWRHEVTQRRKDGTPLHVLSSVSLLRDHTGGLVGMVYVNHDISRRRQTELELKRRVEQFSLLQQLDVKIGSTLNIWEVLSHALDSAARLSGADSGFIVLIEADGGRIIEMFGGYALTVKSGGQNVYGVVGRVMRNQKAELIRDVNADPEYIPDQPNTQALIAIPLMSHDRLIGIINLETEHAEHFTPEIFEFLQILTTRIAAAIDNANLYRISQQQLSELQTLYTQMSQLEQLKTDMIRIASHDLRSPVGIIRGYIDMLQTDAADRLTEGEKDYIVSISKAVQRMENIVNDILSLERIQEMVQQPFTEVVNLVKMAQQAVQMHLPEAESKGQALKLIIPPKMTALNVRGDASQLFEALVNLITNAMKYTPEGGSIMVVLEEADGKASVEVHDTGYGIPESQQEQLFQPFFRASSEEISHIEGLGLGLHLVKNIIQRHEGEIYFTSVYGEGSTFGFHLPLAE